MKTVKCINCPLQCEGERINSIMSTRTLHNRVRILRPFEFSAIVNNVPKLKHRILFSFAFATGARYKELREILKNKDKYIVRRKNRIWIEFKGNRTIRLSLWGQLIAENVLEYNKPLEYPNYDSWQQDLIRWALDSDVCPLYLTTKTLRKTLEVWLYNFYEDRIEDVKPLILNSQGYVTDNSLAYCKNYSFTKEEKDEMKKYLQGWF